VNSNIRLILIPFVFLSLMAGCGGGSSGSDEAAILDDAVVEPMVEEPTVTPEMDLISSGDSAIFGRVATATDNVNLADVEVLLTLTDGDEVATTSTVTDEFGNYVFDNLPFTGIYELIYSLDTYLQETVSNVSFGSNDVDLEFEPVRLISADNAGDGGISGVITDATNGLPLGGVTLELIRGINNTGGELAATVMTADDGSYSVDGLSAGNYTCIIFADGLQTSVITVIVLGNTMTANQNGTISPLVAIGETRIILTWGEDPRDLDSHFTGPTIEGGDVFRVFFGNRQEEDVLLDTDDVSSFGPETITIADSTRPGVFRYSVFNFSGGPEDTLSNSGARVEVIREEGTVAEFFVPQGAGNLWSVFDMENGQITAIGSISIRTSNDNFFAPETLAINANASFRTIESLIKSSN